jgi:hypothetical protein
VTPDQKDTATVWMYGVFCLAMVGVYAWSVWQSGRAQRRLHDRLAAAAESRYEPLLRPVPEPDPVRVPRKRQARRPPAGSDGTADGD